MKKVLTSFAVLALSCVGLLAAINCDTLEPCKFTRPLYSCDARDCPAVRAETDSAGRYTALVGLYEVHQCPSPPLDTADFTWEVESSGSWIFLLLVDPDIVPEGSPYSISHLFQGCENVGQVCGSYIVGREGPTPDCDAAGAVEVQPVLPDKY